MEADNPQFPRRLYTKDDEPFPCKSIGYYSSDTKLFEALYTALEPDEWLHIRNSRLGVFLQFNRINFEWASRMVHYMLGFQIVCHKKYEIWSLVGCNPLRFSLNEFESITGLNCEDVESLEQPEVEVTEEMEEFWEKLGVNVECGPTIEQLTQACNVAYAWDSEDRIRLGYLAIYDGFIEPRKPSTPTRLNLARLVMDLDRFENYPWGRVAFKHLIQSVKDKDITKSYTIDGFVEALQIWVYEAMPDYASNFGDPFPNQPTPPLIAYRGSRGRKYMKEGILKQTRFNHIRMIGDRVSPVWEDDVEDDKIDNIIRCLRGEFGIWKWHKRLWESEGIKVSNNVKVETKRAGSFPDESGKRHHPGTSTEVGVNILDAMKQEINSWGSALLEEMRVGFRNCDSRYVTMNEKIEGMATDINELKAAITKDNVKSKEAPLSATEKETKEASAEEIVRKDATPSPKTEMVSTKSLKIPSEIPHKHNTRYKGKKK